MSPSVDLPTPFGPVIASRRELSTETSKPRCTATPARPTASPEADSTTPGSARVRRTGNGGGKAGTQIPRAASRGVPAPRQAFRRRSRRQVRARPHGRRRPSQVATRCSTTMSVDPVASSTRATASRTSVTPDGSRLAVGSSSSRMPGRIASAPARASRWLCPPESADVERSSATSSPTASSDSRTRGQISSRGNPEVLAAECDIVADAREHHLRVGVLLHESNTAPGCPGLRAPRPAARPRTPPRPRRAPPRSRAAGWTCPSRRRRAAARARPARCAARGRARPRRGVRRAASPIHSPESQGDRRRPTAARQTRSAASRPEANRLSAPVRASALREQPAEQAGEQRRR